MLWRKTGGRCWYCGGLVTPATPGRDWLVLYPKRSRMVKEHTTPVCRGGRDDIKNYVPSCGPCNHAKGAFTVDEFRLWKGLRAGCLDFRFAFDAPASVRRDWIVCHSTWFERNLVQHNLPSAADAYELRARGRAGAAIYKTRVRSVAP